jgi:hypothetical protein
MGTDMQQFRDRLETEAKNFFTTMNKKDLMETRAFQYASLRTWVRTEKTDHDVPPDADYGQ